MSNSFASVTRAEYDAELLKLPIDLRAGFANSPRRVNDLLVRMLVQKSLAAQARAAKIDAKPDAALRIRLEVDRLLSQMMIESIEANAETEFDANRARYEARAREDFIARQGEVRHTRAGERDAHPVRHQEAHLRRGEEARAGRAREDPRRRGHE